MLVPVIAGNYFFPRQSAPSLDRKNNYFSTSALIVYSYSTSRYVEYAGIRIVWETGRSLARSLARNLLSRNFQLALGKELLSYFRPDLLLLFFLLSLAS